MKKIILTIVCLIFVLSLVACGSTSIPPADNNTNTTTSVDSATSSVEDTTTDNSDLSENTNVNDSVSDDTSVISFTPVTAVDNEECSITITDIDPDNMWGYTLKATFENKSAETTYMFSVYTGYINGVKCDPFFASEVAPGKKSIEEISFSTDELEENGITDITDIELVFNVYDYNDWAADYVVDAAVVNVYPYGEDKAIKFERAAKSTDIILVDNEYATVIATDFYTDDIWGYTADLYIVNKTDKEVMFSVNEVSVNGFMADPFFATTIMPEKASFESMSWSEDTFAECGITDVENIEFILDIYDANDWLADKFVNENITINP